MAHEAVKGGLDAILAAESLLALGEDRLTADQVARGAGLLVDQVMSETGLYAPGLAAQAIGQAEGDPVEAAFLIRAYRSTLPRLGYTVPADGGDIRILRRISSTFRDVPGGQILGRTRDYTQRLLDAGGAMVSPNGNGLPSTDERGAEPPRLPRVTDELLADQAARFKQSPEAEPFDVTREALRFPAPRSARLQALARGETGFMVAMAYSAQRGFGVVHPTVAELRQGELPVQMHHPLTGGTVSFGAMVLTDVVMVNYEMQGGGPSADGTGRGGTAAWHHFGYGIAFGRHERGAIAMGIVDVSLGMRGNKGPAADEEFVLSHCDGLESTGLVEHAKLPHYVTFQSAHDRASAQRLAQVDRVAYGRLDRLRPVTDQSGT